MVFMVIALTVTIAGLTGGVLARILGLNRPNNDGWVLLGANALARVMGRVLRDNGEPVVLIDANPESCTAAREEGLDVVCGNGLEEATLHDARIDSRRGAIGVIPSDEVNLLFAQRAREEGNVTRLSVALHARGTGATQKMVSDLGGRLLFGRQIHVDLWAVRARRGIAVPQRWRIDELLDDVHEGRHR